MSKKESYSQILKSTSIMGGAAGISLIFGIIRTKFAAVLIGTTGIGLLAGYAAIQGVVNTLAGLGIQSSAVRDIVLAVSSGDQQRIAKTITTLRRICWLTGLFGASATIALSGFLSQLTFNSTKYSFEIALIGIVVLLGNLSGGQMALIQGMRQIADLAKVQLITGVVGTLGSICFYFWLGFEGILPAMILISLTQLITSWFFARRLQFPTVYLSWGECFRNASNMTQLGLSFMWSALMVSLVAYVANILIAHKINLVSVGVYSAAFSLSGIFANFILNAMAADYFPRLTSSVSHNKSLSPLVNQQTEIGVLLAIPGLLVMLTLSPWIIKLFYTAEFLGATELLQWFILGCLGKVISHPISFIMLAKGKSNIYLLSETFFNILHVVLIVTGLALFGLEGVAIAFFVLYLLYILAMYFVAKHLVGFKWSTTSRKILIKFVIFLLLVFSIVKFLPLWPATIFAGFISIIISIECLGELIKRVGRDHRIVVFILKFPGLKLLFN